MTPSLHLDRPAEPAYVGAALPVVQLRTVEHYRLVMGIEETEDPDA